MHNDPARHVMRARFILLLLLPVLGVAACGKDDSYNGRSADEWAGLLRSSNADERARAGEAFSVTGPHQRDHVMALLRAADDPDSTAHVEILNAINKLPDAASKVLVDALRDPHLTVRRAAAAGLGHFRRDDNDSIKGLIASLRDPDDSVRTLAVASLGARSIGALDALPDIRRLATTPGPQRAVALTVLPNIDTESRSLLSVYQPAVSDTSAAVRAAAVSMILTAANDHSVIPTVVAALNDHDPQVRIAAARVLGSEAHHDSVAAQAMRKARASTDSSVRRLADSILAANAAPATIRRAP